MGGDDGTGVKVFDAWALILLNVLVLVSPFLLSSSSEEEYVAYSMALCLAPVVLSFVAMARCMATFGLELDDALALITFGLFAAAFITLMTVPVAILILIFFSLGFGLYHTRFSLLLPREDKGRLPIGAVGWAPLLLLILIVYDWSESIVMVLSVTSLLAIVLVGWSLRRSGPKKG